MNVRLHFIQINGEFHRLVENEEDELLVINALKKVGLYEKINSLDKGIHTICTKEFDKNGIVLSGGQNQRLAIARGYALNYNLFILDEPSSALDPIAEANVYNNMLALGKDKTIIFISHRLASTRFSDRIILIDQGKIIEIGTHDELVRLNGAYAEMYLVQSQYYEEE